MEILSIVDEFSASQLANVEACLSLVEGLILVELVAVGGPNDVGVQVLLRHEQFPIADHRVLEEPRGVVKTVLLVCGHRFLVETDATGWLTRLPVALMLVVGALDGGSEVGGPPVRLVVGGGVHKGLLTIATTEGVQGLVRRGDPVLGIETNRYEFYSDS